VRQEIAEPRLTEPAPKIQEEQSGPAPDVVPATRNNSIMTPAVRHLLKWHNLSVEDLKATGKGGRILKEDVQRYLSELQALSPTPAVKPVVHAGIEDRLMPLTPIQASMSKAMTASLGVPQFLFTHSIDCTSLNNIRRGLNAQKYLLAILDGSTPKITVLPIILKSLSEAFKQYPTINSHYDGSHKELLIKGSHDFGIAMDTPSGLLVPVVRNVQNHSIVSIAAEIERLAALAKDGKLALSDLTGATFTISNIGSIGGDAVSPVIVTPQVGIVALGRVQDVPAFEEDARGTQIVVKKEKMTLSWSADHRVLDGATVARCAQMVKQLLENMEGLGFVLK
jgi:2-oxoisovalerate dehydrogenase E2 component (dihydrolipoyl transacylase)